MLETYFVTQGREWERYAWIKARVVCGDRAAELEALVEQSIEDVDLRLPLLHMLQGVLQS